MDRRLLTAERCWYAVIAVVVTVGFVLQFWLLFTGGADANSGESGSTVPLGIRFVRLFSFFTILSNVLVLIVAIRRALRPDRPGRLDRLLHLDALLSIVVTGTVFGFILAPGLQLREVAVVVTNLFHLVSPLMFALGWAAFGPRRQWDRRIALLAFVWPIVWLAYTFVHGALTGWYPYPFLDAARLGIGAALGGAGIVIAYAVVLAVVLLAIDRWVPALGSRSTERTGSERTGS